MSTGVVVFSKKGASSGDEQGENDGTFELGPEDELPEKSSTFRMGILGRDFRRGPLTREHIERKEIPERHKELGFSWEEYLGKGTF